MTGNRNGAEAPAPRDELALGILREALGALYEIECAAHDQWRWRRRDGLGGTRTALDPDEVQRGIAADAFRRIRGVPR